MKTKKNQVGALRCWRPRDEDEYRYKLDRELKYVLPRSDSTNMQSQLERRCNDIESVLVDVARSWSESAAINQEHEDNHNTCMHLLKRGARHTNQDAKRMLRSSQTSTVVC